MEPDQFPEEVLSLKWEAQLQHKNDFLTEDYVKQNSASYKILNDNFTKVWSSDSDDDSKKKRDLPGKSTQEPRKGICRRLIRLYKPFTAYPKVSCLTVNQHKTYLQLMKKFSNNFSLYMSKKDQEEFQQYQILKERIASEHIEYLEFLRNFAISNQSRYSSICPDIKKYINELWKVKLKNPLKYPRFYRPYRTIGLILNDSKEFLHLKPEDEILKKGRVNILDLNKKHLRIERDYSKFVRRNPIIDQERTNKETTYNCPVSQDQNAEVIAKRMNVDFVLSSSSLKRICDNYPPFNKPWEIPVIVKEYDVEENGHSGKKKVIFIDKALPRRRMTVVDKLILFHKIAIKRLLVNYYSPERLQERSGVDYLNQNNEDFLQLDWNDTNDLESFGVDCPNGSESRVKRSCDQVNNMQLNEKNVIQKETSDEICAPVEKSGLGKQYDNAEVSSVCMSDSDEEQLVIDDPEGDSETKKEKNSQNYCSTSSKYSRENISTISDINAENALSVDESLKPRTRSMAKMLENLQKVEKIACLKSDNSRENISVTETAQLGTFGSSESEKLCSPNEEVSGVKCEIQTGVGRKGFKVKSRALSLLDELLEQQKRWFEHDRPKSNQCLSQSIDIKEKKPNLEDYKPVPPPRDSNYVYRLFSLKKKDLSSSGYRLLIRCKNDAREAPPKQKTATIVSKLEFQPEFGAEIVTVSEMIQDWLSLQIRPNSVLIRARINAFTSDVMMVEQKECKDFLKDEKYHNIQASSCLNTLEAVFRAFCDLPPAQYVFTHEPKMGAFGNIYMATSDMRGGLYDLHEQYHVDTSADEPEVLSSLWIPIDFSIITPLYEELERVPGTFIPKNKKINKRRPKKQVEKNKTPDTTSSIH